VKAYKRQNSIFLKAEFLKAESADGARKPCMYLLPFVDGFGIKE